jgi:hypothetical protein
MNPERSIFMIWGAPAFTVYWPIRKKLPWLRPDCGAGMEGALPSVVGGLVDRPVGDRRTAQRGLRG